MNPTAALCYAWPDTTDESLSLLVGIWGWEVGKETKPLSWDAMFRTLAIPQWEPRFDDIWLIGRCRVQGWQILFETRPKVWTETYAEPTRSWHGGLREIYDNLPFPVIEWTLKGSDQTFDLDILVQQQFFYAHVTDGHLDLSFEEPTGKVFSDGRENQLLLMDVSTELWLHLDGLPQQVAVFSALSSTLAGLGVPEGIWPLASPVDQPTLLRLETRKRESRKRVAGLSKEPDQTQ